MPTESPAKRIPKKQPDDHCNARRANHQTDHTDNPYCSREAGWGTSHPGFGRCKRHGGATKLGTEAAKLEEGRYLAQEGAQLLGIPTPTDPHTALVEELEASSGHVAWLRLKVEEVARTKGEVALTGPVGQEGPSESGGHHYAEEKPNIWWTLYSEERERKVKIAMVCAKAGIEERRIKIAEGQGMVIARVIQGVLSTLGIDSENTPELPSIVRAELTKASEGVTIDDQR